MSLFKSASVVSAFTLLSRITGLVRESLLAYFFGASALTDAFNVAFRIPNLLRRIFAEGAFSQAFVPLLAEAKTQGGDEQTKELVNHVATVLFWSLLCTVVIGIVLAPYLVWAMASGLQQSASESGTNGFTAATVMTRIMFPYILCMSLVALFSSVLNTYKRFALPAFTPVLLNVAMVASAAVGIPYFRAWGIEPVYTLAVGAMLGGILQLSAQLWAVSRLGMRPRIGVRWRSLVAAWKHPKTKRMLTLMGPALLGVSVAQISLLINTQIASHQGAGSVTWLSLADRLMEFPTALVGVALGVVLMPALSSARAAGEQQRYSATIDWGLRLVLLLGAPCAVALIAFSEPLVTLLYHYGQFSLKDVVQTSLAVKAYGVGLLGLLCIKILAPAYYAKQNTKTPVKIALVVLVCTQLLNFVLVPRFAVAGLALSISLGALLNAAWLFTGLWRSGSFAPQSGWWLYLLRLIFANLALGALLWWAAPLLLTELDGAHKIMRAAGIVGACIGAATAYFGLLYFSGLKVHRLARTPV